MKEHLKCRQCAMIFDTIESLLTHQRRFCSSYDSLEKLALTELKLHRPSLTTVNTNITVTPERVTALPPLKQLQTLLPPCFITPQKMKKWDQSQMETSQKMAYLQQKLGQIDGIKKQYVENGGKDKNYLLNLERSKIYYSGALTQLIKQKTNEDKRINGKDTQSSFNSDKRVENDTGTSFRKKHLLVQQNSLLNQQRNNNQQYNSKQTHLKSSIKEGQYQKQEQQSLNQRRYHQQEYHRQGDSIGRERMFKKQQSMYQQRDFQQNEQFQRKRKIKHQGQQKNDSLPPHIFYQNAERNQQGVQDTKILEKMLQMKNEQSNRLLNLLLSKNQVSKRKSFIQQERDQQEYHNGDTHGSFKSGSKKKGFKLQSNQLNESRVSGEQRKEKHSIDWREQYRFEQDGKQQIGEQQRVLLAMQRQQLDELRLISQLPPQLQEIQMEKLAANAQVRFTMKKHVLNQKIQKVQFEHRIREDLRRKQLENQKWSAEHRKHMLLKQMALYLIDYKRQYEEGQRDDQNKQQVEENEAGNEINDDNLQEEEDNEQNQDKISVSKDRAVTLLKNKSQNYANGQKPVSKGSSISPVSDKRPFLNDLESVTKQFKGTFNHSQRGPPPSVSNFNPLKLQNSYKLNNSSKSKHTQN